ncbi:MAG: malate/lactate/ureidoglycolate dehydrogenase [Burkholderiaceae bacterium]|nr:malate/lactate/ureidoglycolate dehydrogenase [Burkholderiaceae bacterium]
MTILANPERLQAFISSIFTTSGSSASEAEQIASHLVGANLAGHDSHGIGLIPAYLAHLEAGLVRPNQVPVRIGGVGPFAVFDGQMGYGQPITNAVMAQAATIAKDIGVALVTLRNVQHVGRVGTYAEALAAQGLMSIHFVNAIYDEPCVAPFRGSDARLMTNPVCIAIPGSRPVLLDFATSGIAMGKVRVAYNKQEPLALGRLIDSAGQPTTSPKVLFEDPKGALLPFGEHKGWGLAFVAEILGGALAGGPTAADAAGRKRGLVNGLFSIVLEPGRLIDGGGFDDTVAQLTDYVKASPAADPERPVLVPGEPERESRAQRGRDGIPVDPATWKQICSRARGLGLVPPEFASGTPAQRP